MNFDVPMTAISRRSFMRLTGGTAVALATAMMPGTSQADTTSAMKSLAKMAGSDKQAKAGRVKFELPQIAENGNTVPLTFEIESAMSDADFVKAVHVVADGNPSPEVASFYFTPMSGRARASTRMRLAKTQNIIAVAEMNDGSLYMAKQEVKVTIGGCGG